MDEQPRPVANGDEKAYTLTVEEAAALYKQAGFSRTLRAIQKYCKRGHLDWLREETTYGERYRITPASVATHIEQLKQLREANGRDHPRPDANVRAEVIEDTPAENDGATVREQPRPDAASDRYVGQLESENAFLRDQIGLKDRQIERRDIQIEAMIERDQETNVLIQQLQAFIPLPEGRTPLKPREEARRTIYTEVGPEAAGEGITPS
jgi:hypothetical protein